MFWQSGCRGTPVPPATHQWSRRLVRLTAIVLTPVLVTLALKMPVQAQETVHIIVPGDNLTRVAQQYNIDPTELAAYNNIVNPNHIVLGQALKIPAVREREIEQAETQAGEEIGPSYTVADTPVDKQPTAALNSPVTAPLPGKNGYHAVKAGESLTAIAQRYGLTTDDLLRLNGLTDANHILVGQVLRLSARASVLPSHNTSRPSLATTIYVVQEGDTLSEIAYAHRVTMEQLLRDNGLPHEGAVYVGQKLRIEEPSDVATGLDTSQAPANGTRKIVIDLSDQTLTAYQGDVVVMHTYVSTGKAATPTVIGDFNIYLKYQSQRMTGPDYDLEGVPWVMYYDGDFGIHGAYWHNAFGVPTSHGCTNMRPDEAKALYAWADIGTRVVVQW